MTLTREIAAAILERCGAYGYATPGHMGNRNILDDLLRKHGLNAFTDEFVDEFVRANGRNHRFAERLNIGNRAALAHAGADQ